MLAGEPDPEKGISKLPDAKPLLVGAKVTRIRQLPCADSALLQLLLKEYGPETEIVPRGTDAGVELIKVTSRGFPGRPAYWLPNVRL